MKHGMRDVIRTVALVGAMVMAGLAVWLLLTEPRPAQMVAYSTPSAPIVAEPSAMSELSEDFALELEIAQGTCQSEDPPDRVVVDGQTVPCGAVIPAATRAAPIELVITVTAPDGSPSDRGPTAEEITAIVVDTCGSSNTYWAVVQGRWYACDNVNATGMVNDVTDSIVWNELEKLIGQDNANSIRRGLTLPEWEAEGRPDPAERCRRSDYPAAIQIKEQAAGVFDAVVGCDVLMEMTIPEWVAMKAESLGLNPPVWALSPNP